MSFAAPTAFSSRSFVLVYFVPFALPVLYRSSDFLRGVFMGSFLCLGVLRLGSLSIPHPCASLMLGSLRAPFLRPWLRHFQWWYSFLLCVRSVLWFLRLGSPFGSLSLPLPCGSPLHFLSIYWVLWSLPLPLLFLLLPGLLPFILRVPCSWVLLPLGGVHKGSLSFFVCFFPWCSSVLPFSSLRAVRFLWVLGLVGFSLGCSFPCGRFFWSFALFDFSFHLLCCWFFLVPFSFSRGGGGGA